MNNPIVWVLLLVNALGVLILAIPMLIVEAIGRLVCLFQPPRKAERDQPDIKRTLQEHREGADQEHRKLTDGADSAPRG